MAGLLYNRRQYGQAERVARQLIAARPANADAHNILGVSLAGQGKFDEAIASLRRATKIAPQAASFFANLGEVLRQAGKLDEAEKALDEAVRIDPNNAQALNNLGIIRYDH
jgi:Flp pilus assembly protein TadD